MSTWTLGELAGARDGNYMPAVFDNSAWHEGAHTVPKIEMLSWRDGFPPQICRGIEFVSLVVHICKAT